MTTAVAERPTTVTPPGSDGVAASVQSQPASLFGKLATIAGAAQPTATGKTQQGKTVFSIGDVEAAVGPLFAHHGIVTRWSTVALDSYDQPTKEGSMRMWIAHLRVRVIDATSGESFEDEWIDVGTNPMAAASFVRKGYYKALLHLAEDADEGKADAPASGGGEKATARASSAPRTPASAPRGDRTIGPKLACERCQMAGYKNRKGYAATIWPDRIDCDGVDPEGEPQRHQRPVDVASIPEPQRFADGSPIPDDIPF